MTTSCRQTLMAVCCLHFHLPDKRGWLNIEGWTTDRDGGEKLFCVASRLSGESGITRHRRCARFHGLGTRVDCPRIHIRNDFRRTREMGANFYDGYQSILVDQRAVSGVLITETCDTTGMSETITSGFRPPFDSPRPVLHLTVSSELRARPWFGEIFSRFRTLLELGENWNGYGEKAVHGNAVKRALNVLEAIGTEGPGPWVVPTFEGGLANLSGSVTSMRSRWIFHPRVWRQY